MHFENKFQTKKIQLKLSDIEKNGACLVNDRKLECFSSHLRRQFEQWINTTVNFRAVFSETWIFFLHHWLQDPCHCELKLTTTTTNNFYWTSQRTLFFSFRFKNRLETTNSRYDKFVLIAMNFIPIYKSKVSLHSCQLM